ncbi:multidrug ABC transporter permease [Bacillus xiamenensis]|uniref:ABC transporter ATP-binding protein/permease n=1 Tax=Bacillus xiamenensis TaxID=1178537 RepID=A0AAC9IE62_9BACI|nr:MULTISPECIES: ABC transporter ATP-binding protein [Bacillus]AOZ87830.1 multidrug ABC transporter permease [Bacillus xiamenensis]EKF33768.1 ABC transporter ATP-binding protein [Bacillus xiamenensis]MBG9910807.1 multidrug ABC transporter permease [Bacillus xiamenensis]MCW1837796.1 ABC transporter ATP-binding protein/permease [Bacillus xiamenensis]MCY9577188.1 ABC transporter ATP-binding protein/permease [Bacillus xiamenensis]
MTTGRRLLAYALLYKKILSVALVFLIIAVGAELTGPFIGKKMIDDHILGVEKPYVEVNEKTDQTVYYQGNNYIRNDRLKNENESGKQINVVQVGFGYYVVNEPIRFDGNRTITGNQLTIENGNERKTYEVQRLSKEEIFAFYQPEISGLVQLVLFYLGLLIIAIFFQYGQHYLLQRIANRIIQKMRVDVFEHIQTLPIRYFDNLPAGKVVARITNDTETIRDLYVTVLANFVTSAVYMIGIYIAMFLLNVKLALICLVAVPIIFLWSMTYRKFASVYNHRIRSIISEINAKLNEAIQGMTIIQAFRHEKATKEEFDELNNNHFQYKRKMLHLNSLLSHNLVNLLRNLAYVALIWYFGGASLSASGIVSIGVLYAFVDYLNRLFQPITGIVNQFSKLELARVSSERVFRLLDEPGTEVEEPVQKKIEGHVQFQDVTFAYNEGKNVLKNITFEAKKGQTVALVGHTGSGKSSIMNLLLRFYDIQQGDILIDGESIYQQSRQTLRQHMGIVLQDPYLFSGTIASNVSLGNEDIKRETIETSLKQVGAAELLKHLPEGFDEPVVEKGSTLSSGERQLISFARALAYDPAILILDEATANIDTETEAIIQRALDVVKEGRTTFVIAHRLSTIKKADMILVLEKGEIVERGSHEGLMEQGGLYAQMYELQKGAVASS